MEGDVFSDVYIPKVTDPISPQSRKESRQGGDSALLIVPGQLSKL